MARTTLSVDGMACDGCESAVVDALTAIDGVSSVEADHEADEVAVEYDEDAVSVDDLGAAIDEAGYAVVA